MLPPSPPEEEHNMEPQMKVDKAKLRQLRDAKCWSQEHLASAAGLSLRTIQRMESDGAASAESKLAVAAALQVPVAILSPQADHAAPASPASRAAEAVTALPGSIRRGTRLGYAGVAAGTAAASLGVLVGGNTSAEAGMYLGIVFALAGACCAVIGLASRRMQPSATGLQP
jgi:transcriptional regulator with XRE-family HTH domain